MSIERPPHRASSALLILTAALALGACTGTRGGPVPYDVKGFGAPDIVKPTDQAVEYHIGGGDVLSVVVFRVPTLSGDFTVDAAGRFSMPLIGQVLAAGKTPEEVSRELETSLAAKYLQKPEVSVTLKSAVNQRVTIDGSVTQAGVYPISGRLSLIQALALARGPDKDANPHRVVVFRQINGQRNAAAFDLSEIRKGQAPDPEVFANDVIVVDGSRTRSVFRDFLSSVPLFALFRPF